MSLSMKLYRDNKTVISIAHNHVHHDRTKHVEINRHFIKENVNSGKVFVVYIPTGQKAADILTKRLFSDKFEYFVSKSDMISIYDPT